MTGSYRIAELNIEITSLFGEVHRLCRDYQISDRPIDLAVKIGQQDILYERNKVERANKTEMHPAYHCSDSYLETLVVHRKIAEKLPAYDAFLMHGSCVAVDGKAFLFTAKSGTGKSTHTSLWREMFGGRAVMVNDDKPVIRVRRTIDDKAPDPEFSAMTDPVLPAPSSGASGSSASCLRADQTDKRVSGTVSGVSGNSAVPGGAFRATIYGTPWDGKHRLSTNLAVPLQAICILERAEKNEIHPISFREAYPMLLQQIYRPADPKALEQTLQLTEQLKSAVGFYRLSCNMDPDAARVAYEGMIDLKGRDNIR